MSEGEITYSVERGVTAVCSGWKTGDLAGLCEIGGRWSVAAAGANADDVCPLTRRQLAPDKLPLLRRTLAARNIPAAGSGDAPPRQ